MKREHQTILALIAAGSLASVLMAGCCNSGLSSKRGGCNDVTPGAMPDECGESLNRFALMQKRSAEALSYAIFTNEWYMGGQTLGPYGAYHVQQMSKLLPTVPYNVLIQPSLDPALNEARRQLVVARLLTAGVLDAEVRVRLEYIDADRIYGEEAPIIYNQMIQMNGNGSQGYGSQGAGTYLPGNVSGGAGGFGGFGGFGGY